MTETDTQVLEFKRPNKSVPWGFSIQGGKEFGCPLSVLRVTSGSVAEQLGLIAGSLIVKINNLPTDPMTHQQAILQIQNLNVFLEVKKESKGNNLFPSSKRSFDNYNNSYQVSGQSDDFPPPPPPIVAASYQSPSSSLPLPPPPLPFLKELQSTTSNTSEKVPGLTKKLDGLESIRSKNIFPITTDSKKFEDKQYIPAKKVEDNEKKTSSALPIVTDMKKLDISPQRPNEKTKAPTSSSSLGSFILNQSNNPSRDSNDLLVTNLIPDKQTAICFVCKDHIKDSYIEANNKVYCNNHFCCSFCGQPITSGQFIETKEGTLYCIEDFTNHVAPKCHKCNKPVVVEQVIALDNYWHKECFVCDHCKKPMPKGQFHVQEDNGKMTVFCEKDFKEFYEIKCSSCGLAIEADEKYLLVSGKNMHVNCFKR